MKITVPALLITLLVLEFTPGAAQKAPPKPDPTPLDTSFLLNVNGVSQYLEIKAHSRSNPVLLFIHGGPCWPATPMIRKYNQDLANNFVLVSWDQRNCGKSGTDSTTRLTPDLYVEDAHQVTQYLKKKFHTDKIFIVGHSWGTIVGIYLIQKYPEDYAAYVGMGQFVDPDRSDAFARDHVTKQAKLNNDSAVLNALSAIPFSEENGYKNGFFDMIRFWTLANKYTQNSKIAGLPDPTQLYEDYSKLDWMSPLMSGGMQLFNYMDSIKINFFRYKEFKIPVYFFAGRYDYNTSSIVVEQYYKTIKAPKKNLYWFENSGHSPCWEEPQLFYQRLLQIAAN